jgi:septal ring factor EnvC (AmiA/AmiB activator)
MRDVPQFTRHTQTARGFGLPVNRVIVTAVAALLIVGGAVLWRIGATAPPVVTAVKVAPAKNPAIDELVGTTKALDASQQQVVDQLQVMQDMLTSQQAEMKRTSDRVAALNANLESLRQSFASAPPTTTTEEAEAPPPKKVARASRPRGRARAQRAASGRKTVVIQVKKQRSASKR